MAFIIVLIAHKSFGTKSFILSVVIALSIHFLELHNPESHPKKGSFEEQYKLNVAENYLISSAIPSFMLLAIAIYGIIKKSFGLKRKIKYIFCLVMILQTAGLIIYQSYEITSKSKEWPVTILIYLPRTIYAVAALSVAFLITSLFFPGCLYDMRPTDKRERIISFYTLLVSSLCPIFLIIAGPYQQIIYLNAIGVAFGIGYCLQQAKLINSYFHYTFIPIVAFRIFYDSGHRLDFLSPRLARAFVGFPEFQLVTTFSIVIVDFVSTTVLFILLSPLVTACYEAKDDNINGMRMLPSEHTPSGLNPDPDPEKRIVSKEDNISNERDIKMQMTVFANYFAMLAYFDIVQDCYTWFLVYNFEDYFFYASHTEFSFRFINWAMYLITAFSILITGKV